MLAKYKHFQHDVGTDNRELTFCFNVLRRHPVIVDARRFAPFAQMRVRIIIS